MCDKTRLFRAQNKCDSNYSVRLCSASGSSPLAVAIVADAEHAVPPRSILGGGPRFDDKRLIDRDGAA
jgi:hypothetical protein